MTTTISIYEAIGRNLGDVLAKGTPTGATGTTFDSSSMIFPLSNQLKGKTAYFFEGVGSGQARTITAFDPANNRSTVDPQFDTVPSASSRFLIFDHFDMEDYENAMNRAMGMIRLKHLDEKVATMELVATQYEYPVPSGFELVSLLRLVPSGWNDYSSSDDVNRIFELPPRYWRIEPNPLGTYIIVIDPRKISLDDFDEQWVHVIGQAKPDFGSASIPEALQEYIINYASMLLASIRISENQEWRAKVNVFKQLTQEMEPYIYSRRYGRSVG